MYWRVRSPLLIYVYGLHECGVLHHHVHQQAADIAICGLLTKHVTQQYRSDDPPQLSTGRSVQISSCYGLHNSESVFLNFFGTGKITE